ncbi:hypothetical protein SARC_10698 [Sphaeroforma arctica JP610]|uniref:Uncharacterized protein n=1 Tax=Sphaeroforma arctica JP610 TaxID=667725 RepID=A0A0L0FJ63_9EUKA|nr:hypothetical protein SARC_10698 [Sphaeroforma arctica JP610]KNC76824.1 hypothetical protein SARC_10698 [Sphaeroforma arctica JP610]|eukprot:XP_014150726.1 hypothetical protein SARC_10698 [Sphaeroforma arctica JP610]
MRISIQFMVALALLVVSVYGLTEDLSPIETTEMLRRETCPQVKECQAEHMGVLIGIFVSGLIFFPLGYITSVIINNRRNPESQEYIGLKDGTTDDEDF